LLINFSDTTAKTDKRSPHSVMSADFYVQDERYAALTRMWRSSDVQNSML